MRVRWGIAAQTLALGAKMGGIDTPALEQLFGEAAGFLPADRQPIDAVLAFAITGAVDKTRAGDDLIAFLQAWLDEDEVTSGFEHDWQRRADCGL